MLGNEFGVRGFKSAIVAAVMCTVFQTSQASAPLSPSIFTLDGSSISCDAPRDQGDYPIDLRLRAHPAYKQLSQVDWISAVPNAHWFRNATAGSVNPLTIALTNQGNSAVKLVGISGLGGSDFVYTGSLPITVAAKSQQNLNFEFVPLIGSPVSQELSATLKFSDGSTEPLYLWGERIDERNTTAVPVTACGVLDSANTFYQLQNNVSADDSCFLIKAPNIDLDLNGFKITYDQDGQAAGETEWVHGIVAAAAWAAGAKPAWSGGLIEGLTVRNGTIEQAGFSGGGPATPSDHAHGIFLNEQGDSYNIELAGLTINVHGHSAQGIRLRSKRAVYLHGNTINSKVTSITNRHQIDGAMVHISNSNDGNGFARIEGNTLDQGAQGGIWAGIHNAQLRNNQITHYGLFTNDFGIYALGDNSDVFNNTVAPSSGRGIMVSGKRVSVYGNDVDVTGLPINAEYAGCELGGHYGIQLETGSYNSLILNNDVVAVADQCDAVGIKVTGPNNAYVAAHGRGMSNNIVMDNTVSAVKAVGGNAGVAQAFGLSDVENNAVVSYRNSYKTDGVAIHVNWDGLDGIEFIQDSFTPGGNLAALGSSRSNRWFMYFYNGTNLHAVKIFLEDLAISDEFLEADPTFAGAKVPLVKSFVENTIHGKTEYYLAHGAYVKLTKANGDKVSSASVVYSDLSGKHENLLAAGEGGARILARRISNSTDSAALLFPSKPLAFKPVRLKKGAVVQELEQVVWDGFKGYECRILGKSAGS